MCREMTQICLIPTPDARRKAEDGTALPPRAKRSIAEWFNTREEKERIDGRI